MKIVTMVLAAVLLAAGLALAQSEPYDLYEGTWVLNVAQSGGEARTQILTIQIAGDRETYRSELVSADGHRQVTTYTAAYDGKEYPSETVMTRHRGNGPAAPRYRHPEEG